MKLDSKRTVLVGLAFLSICAFWQVYDGIVPLILKNTFHVGDTLSGAIMALDNVLALVLLPVFGSLSDRTQTRLGRRMPYILGGTAAACVFMLWIPLADRLYNLPLFFMGLGLVLLSMATYRSPAVALMPDVTPKPLRSKGNAIINLMGAVGGIVMLLAIKLLVPKTDHPNYIPLFALTALLMAACAVVLAVRVREPALVKKMEAESRTLAPEAPEETTPAAPREKLPRPVFRSLCFILASVFFWFMGYNAVTTSFSKYANLTWGMEGGDYAMVLMIAQAAAILTYIPVGIIASRVGRKKTILAGVVMLAVSFGAAMFLKSFEGIIFFFFALAGVAWAFINVNSYPMVVEMSQGADVGKYTGYYYTFSMTAQILTPVLSGALMEHIGYHTLFPYAAICVAISFVTMLFVRHGDSRPQPAKSKLEAFDLDD